MEGLIALLILGALGALIWAPFGLYIKSLSTSSARHNKTMKALAKRRGLDSRLDSPRHVAPALTLTGSIGAEAVEIRPGLHGRKTLRVMVRTTFPRDVDIWGRGLEALRGEFQTGADGRREYSGGTLIAGTTHPSEAGPGYFKGPEAHVLARMTAETRGWLLEAMKTSTEIEAGWLVITGAQHMKLEKLESFLDAALSLARQIGDEHVVIEDALIAGAHSDPNPAFRHRCFECLRTDGARRQAAEQMVQHDLPETRLVGATADPVKWAPILIELIEGPHPSQLRIRAVEALGVPQAPPEVRAKLTEWVGDPLLWESAPALAVAIAEACLGAEAMIPYEIMQRAIGAHGDENDRHFAASLGSLPTAPWPEAEALLLRLLESDDETVATAAAHALERRGTIDAVHPLMTRSEGFTRGTALKTAARGAIAAIQARAGDVEGGRLALSDDPEKAGGVAIVDSDEG